MQLINKTICRLGIGECASFRNLTVFPLLGPSLRQPDYITLRQAVGDKTARVREVSDAGSVPELLLDNRGEKPVLVVEGEELIGSKQNRTANVTVLAPARSTLRIPVACVEAGRWRLTRGDSSVSDQFHFYGGRKGKMASVFASRRATGRADADQAGVWAEIDAKSVRMSVGSRTSAMSDVFDAYSDLLSDYVAAFEAGRGQVGAVFAIGARIEGMELFDSEVTLGGFLPQLVRSYAIDAMEVVGPEQRPPTPDHARAFLNEIAAATVEQFASVGLGTEVRISSPRTMAAGLVHGERVVHLAAFANESERSPGRGVSDLFARFRDRRRARRR